MMLLSAMMMTQSQLPKDPMLQIALATSYVFINALFFLMLYTGRTDVYRATFFITLAIGFDLFHHQPHRSEGKHGAAAGDHDPG
jgi:hypothetical protein